MSIRDIYKKIKPFLFLQKEIQETDAQKKRGMDVQKERRRYFSESSQDMSCHHSRKIYYGSPYDCITANRIVQFLVQDIMGVGIKTENKILERKFELYDINSFVRFCLESLLRNTENGILILIIEKGNRLLEHINPSDYIHFLNPNIDFSNGRDKVLACINNFSIYTDKNGYKGITVNDILLKEEDYCYLNWNNKKTIVSDINFINTSFYGNLVNACKNLESILESVKAGFDQSKVLVIKTKMFEDLYSATVSQVLEKIGEFGTYSVVRLDTEDSITNMKVEIPDLKPVFEAFQKHMAMLANIPPYILWGREHGSLASGVLADTELQRYFNKLVHYRNTYVDPIINLFIRKVFNLSLSTYLIDEWGLKYYIDDLYNYNEMEKVKMKSEKNKFLFPMYQSGNISSDEYRKEMGF